MNGDIRPAVVASDCDGTLLRSDGTVSEHTRQVLGRLEQSGRSVVLVTARPPRWMDELADVVGGHGIALCGNGAFTYDVSSREVVAHRLMAAEHVASILADIRAELPEMRFALEGLRGFSREPEFERASGRRDGEWLVGTLEQLSEEDAGKILVRHPTWSVDEVFARVTEVVGERAEVSHSGAVGMAEIAAAGVTKGLALADWCAEHGVAAEAVWAFGDMPNDLPMLRWAGRSFAVANAHPDVRTAVTDHCPGNDDDGVARTLETLINGLAR